MTTPRLDDARALARKLQDALAGTPGATATVNAAEVSSGARFGVALVQPPSLAFPTMSPDYDTEWPVHLIAGPARDPIQAWATLDALLEQLLEAEFPILKAEPASFQPPQGEQLPAYTLTITG